MKLYNIIIILNIIILVLQVGSCRNEDLSGSGQVAGVEIDTPDWSEETHGEAVSPNYDVVFQQNTVLRFDIRMSQPHWQLMQTDLATNTSSGRGPAPGGAPGSLAPSQQSSANPVWVPCSVFFKGKEWYQVGIRYKGNSSLQSTYRMGIGKLSFKLDFDQYEDEYPSIKNQRFYGFKQLNLKNNFDDRSLMREKVASDLFMDFGLTSPQTAFCEVYVDYGSGPVYFGLYTLVEEVDDTVLETQFADGTGNLYKPDGNAASFASGSYNKAQMEKKTNEEASDYSDVKALYDVLNSSVRTSNIDQWKADLENVLDVDVFLKWLAANTAMQNWDTYGRMTHNYYLYNNPDNHLLCWIPWDNNEALEFGKQGGALSLSLDEVGNGWPLIRYLVDVPDYKQQYLQYLKKFVDDYFKPSKMIELYSEYYDLLKEYAYAEQSDYSFLKSSSDFDNAVSILKKHVQSRNTEVYNYVE